jgi:VIT1/CCC1 family predicted Fe2+/Mn2+ transporter/rubrerythrin
MTVAETTEAAGRSEAVARLLDAWRGEIQARAVYSLLAERESDPRRADVIRRIADGEARHRERIEGRMRELGVPVPRGSVRISPWLRLQVRLATPERLLASMEANEEVEIGDRYQRPTGDPETDAVLASIRKDEEQHSRQLHEIRGAGPAADPPGGAVRKRLDRILGRETWHRSGSGWISGVIYGANDGLAAVFGIVAGVSGATGGSQFVLLAGLSGAVASGLSMATGAFLAERSENEVAAANLSRERQEIEEHPEEEQEELSLFYQLKGLTREDADLLAEKLSHTPDAMLKALAAEELQGASAEGGNPAQAALAAGVSTFLGAMVPVLPFFWLRGTVAILTAAAVSLIAHFLVGAAKSLFTLRRWWSAGLEMTAAGVIVGLVTYGVGLVFHA